jgi:sulfite oxidase
VQETPITSAIISPLGDKPVKLAGRTIKAEGYALAGGGRAVIRVDVSADNGDTWTAAELLPEGENQGYRRHWAWRHWRVCCVLALCPFLLNITYLYFFLLLIVI